jgi:hypothetical protein
VALLSAQTIVVPPVDAGLPTWAEWLFGWGGVVGAAAAVVAIFIAVKSLQESNRLRDIAIRETRLDRAERRLEALARLAVLLHVLSERAQNGDYRRAILAREEIRVIAKSHRLEDVQPTLTPVISGPLERWDVREAGAMWAAAIRDADAAIPGIHVALDAEAKNVHELSRVGDR